MKNELRDDPLSDVLSGLTPVAPRESHVRLVRGRCHHLLALRRRVPQASTRPFAAIDMLLGTAVMFYVVAVVSEAVRLLGATSQ